MLERHEREELQGRIEKGYGLFAEARVEHLVAESAVEARKLEIRQANSENMELTGASNERKYKAELESLYHGDHELSRLTEEARKAEYAFERKRADVESLRLTVRLWGAPVPDNYQEGSKP